jgi:hypothetical protein
MSSHVGIRRRVVVRACAVVGIASCLILFALDALFHFLHFWGAVGLTVVLIGLANVVALDVYRGMAPSRVLGRLVAVLP